MKTAYYWNCTVHIELLGM